MQEEYKTVYRGGEGEIVEKKSRFIATVRPVHSEEEVLAFIKKGNANLGAMGFTDHSEAHSGPGADRVRYRIA